MLHPAVIDDYGLVKAIEWYTGVFQKQNGIETSVSVQGEPGRITGQTAIHCFRIVQEALNNAAKHSGTRRAELRATTANGTLEIEIKDFGRGMPASKKGEAGLGVIAMRERAELLCGSLRINSIPDVGTSVCLEVPLRQEDPSQEQSESEYLEEVIKS
jgi:signal transduction histidine kinase